MKPAFQRAIWVLNTVGFVAYLAWLSTLDARQTLREQDGILYYLPCVPFVFVYLLLLPPKAKPPEAGPPAGPPDDHPDSAA